MSLLASKSEVNIILTGGKSFILIQGFKVSNSILYFKMNEIFSFTKYEDFIISSRKRS